jgi:hypothetical protein
MNIPFLNSTALKNVGIIAKHFPGIESTGILEFELDQFKPDIDYSVCLLKNEAPFVIAYWQSESINREMQLSRVWRNIIQFCNQYVSPDSQLGRNVENIWFEFDHHQIIKPLPEPCLFITPKQLPHNSGPNDWLIYDAMAVLAPGIMTAEWTHRIQHCFRSLPSVGAIFQVGILLSRQLDSVRLCTTMPTAEYPAYLKKIRWPGSMEYLEPVLNTFSKYVDKIFLDIDVCERVLPKIGIECCYKKREDYIPDLEDFFALLVDLQFCTRNNANEIILWLNNKNEGLLAGEKKLNRGFSHIKVALESDNTASAKAYLSLNNY